MKLYLLPPGLARFAALAGCGNGGGGTAQTGGTPGSGGQHQSSGGGVPHIIILHIGTNDSGSFTATQMTSDLTGLLDKIIADAPDALLVVA